MTQPASKPKTRQFLRPGEPLSPHIIEQLKQINASAKTHSFQDYLKRLRVLFAIPDEAPLDRGGKFYLGGFVVGEGSLNVAISRLTTARFGVTFRPAFSLTQHVNGVDELYRALAYFQTGRLGHKSGSLATLEVAIWQQDLLWERVVPFYEHYVIHPYGSAWVTWRTAEFKRFPALHRDGAHRDSERMIQEMLPLWDSLRVHRQHKNQVFKTLTEAQDYVVGVCREKKATARAKIQRAKVEHGLKGRRTSKGKRTPG